MNKSLQMADLETIMESMSPNDIGSETNAPGRIRTCDLRIRNPLLYPAELRALQSLNVCSIATYCTSCQLFAPSYAVLRVDRVLLIVLRAIFVKSLYCYTLTATAIFIGY